MYNGNMETKTQDQPKRGRGRPKKYANSVDRWVRMPQKLSVFIGEHNPEVDSMSEKIYLCLLEWAKARGFDE